MVSRIDASRITEGTELYGSEGEKLGKVIAVRSDSVVVEKGLFFPTDRSIPMSAVASVEDGKAYLNVTKDAALNQTWDTAPVTETYATTETTTSRAATAPMATESVDAAAWPAPPVDDRGGMRHDAAAAFDHSQTSDRTHQNTADGLTLQVHEEELSATTRTRDIGEVQIEKDVVSEQRTIEVPVTEERLRVQRHAVDRPLAAGETAFEGATIDVPIMGEEVQLQKQVRVAEEVEVGKEAVQRTEQATGTVRREEVRVTETGETGLADTVGGTQPKGNRKSKGNRQR